MDWDDLARNAKKKEEMEERLVRFNKAISLARDDKIDKALEMFMVIRKFYTDFTFDNK
jgi:hypothetical protein